MRSVVEEIKREPHPLESSRIWDLWRANYHFLSYAEQQEIWEALFPRIDEQQYSDVRWFFKAFRELAEWGLDLSRARVVELGSYNGWLGAQCMREFGLGSWTGYEMVSYAVNQTSQEAIDLGVRNIVADRNLWEMEGLEPFDIFVSAHTIEHLSTTDCIKLIDFVCQRSQILLLELPTLASGQTWKGTISSHILGMSQHQLIEVINNRWVARFNTENPPPNVLGDKAAILRLLGREKVYEPRTLHRDTDHTTILGAQLWKEPYP